MKKATKIALIISASLVAIGIVFCVASFAAAGWDIRAYKTEESVYTRKTCEYDSNAVCDFIFTDASRDVKFICSDDDKIHITYYENDRNGYTFHLSDDGTLKMTYRSSRKWYFIFGFNFHSDNQQTVIAIPAGYTGNLTIKLASGDLAITELMLTGKLSAKSASGDMEITRSSVTDEVSLSSASGEIALDSLFADDVQIKTTSGDIDSRTLICGTLTLSSTSGDISMQETTCDTLSAKAVSGNIEITALTAEGNIQCKTTSGEIDLTEMKGNDFILHSTSGNVRAGILGNENEYDIRAKTTSGNIRVPDANGYDKTIDVSTVSGNIRITLTKQSD